MGKKKKFIDKKKSATFQLLARDTSDPNYTETPAAGGSDRVFVRVDNNPYSFDVEDDDEDDHNDPNSIFADAPEDEEDDAGEDDRVFGNSSIRESSTSGDVGGAANASLPEHIRREILESGFPDDGYNYLIHLREIKNSGGGSAFYQNPKARLDLVSRDVKAYDASRVRIQQANGGDSNDSTIYDVASRTVNVRRQKAVDPEIAAMLDDSDLSQFASDVEDLEEDFVVQANLPEEGESLAEENSEVTKRMINESVTYGNQENVIDCVSMHEVRDHQVKEGDYCVDENPRVRRLLDEQFDLLEQQEYGTDDDDDDYDDYVAAEEEQSLSEKLKHVLNDNVKDDLELDDKYELPPDDILHRCAEYAKKYEDESEDEEVVVEQESSDESEQWDCETIVSTYSNLDNHPGRIGAPETARKKKLAETVSRASSSTSHVISLGGKEKLPIDFLPRSKTAVKEKVQSTSCVKAEPLKRKQHGQESKEEKKERKAAVKEERREARKMKKEMKELYRSEAQRAQKAAAISAPSSIRIM